MEAMGVCPVCDVAMPLAELEAHVNLHFDDATVQQHSNDKEEQGSHLQLQKLPITVEDLIPVQTCDLQFHEGRDIVDSIATAFRNIAGNSNTTSLCYLAGRTQHFCSQTGDKGFGCGYRNLQMLVSHLLTRSELFRGVIFGGVEFVPDIATLQAWLECCWKQGYDLQGMDTLNGHVQGSRKWIGTTDVVSVLRQFGVRAEFVDFLGTHSVYQSVEYGGDAHSGVCCDFCRLNPIIGRRHVSLESPDFDLCDHCIHTPAAENFAPFNVIGQPVIHPKTTCDGCRYSPIIGIKYLEQERPRRNLCESCYWSSHSLDQARYEPVYRPQHQEVAKKEHKHEKLIHWVWKYFTGEEDYPEDSTGISEVIQTGKAPLYFQHDGHSRTIVGIEQVTNRRRNSSTLFSLIILDPSTQTTYLEHNLRRGVGWQRQVKRGIHTLQKTEYQLIYVEDGIVVDPEQRSALKTLRPKEQIWS